jgi:ATP-dependent Lhr-like helicase
MPGAQPPDPLASFGPATRAWFRDVFEEPTRVQAEGWPHIAAGEHSLLIAPTGSGKTLAAFLSCIDAITRRQEAEDDRGYRVVYVSPLKALVYDIERNLRAPLAGVERTALHEDVAVRIPRVDIRTGDTPSAERQRQRKHPGEILVTTPESLYLMLTSQAREVLRTVETVIVDEIHVMAATKRGAHLALTLERLTDLADGEVQRIGLSATQRPVQTAARFLGGDRPVQVVDASEAPRVELSIRVPVDDMENPPRPPPPKGPPASPEARRRSRGRRRGASENDDDELGRALPREQQPQEYGVWPSIYPELLKLIREHRSTIVFTNSRALCERITRKVNELAGEELVLAHHGSIAHDRRALIEERLKEGSVPALVATSSLELGIDMGAVDLVILIESPGAVSRGLQRVGRAGHGVGETSRGVVFPKFRGDLLESAVVAERMAAGAIEPSQMPRNCLDVLAQQVVAMVAMEPRTVDGVLALVQRAAPFKSLTRDLLCAVLDMLSGRYPSDEFAELTPRMNWDRGSDELTPRKSARTLSVLNAGTIPDRGLFRVHISAEGQRLGELDEEMVFETRVGDTLVLGASTWRVDEIDNDRVMVSPAPGQPGRMPFWRGERPGRPLALGRALGEFLRGYDEVRSDKAGGASAAKWLEERTPLDDKARRNLMAYLDEQKDAAGALPTDRSITVERFRDELGDWRICVLTPFGSRVHAPWALALEAVFSKRAGFDVQVMYSDDGLALQLADTDEVPDTALLFPEPEEIEDLVVEQLAHSAMFATHFRENAARALLLPRRGFQGRTPLWLQRRKSSSLLSVAQRFPDFPIVLETYRECLQDVFDVPALTQLLSEVRRRDVRVNDVETRTPSPFARSLVFQYVASYLYDGDAPLAERRAQALGLDRGLLRELLGQEELRDLLDPVALDELERELQWLDEGRHLKDPDHVHDLLRRLGDLSGEEVRDRAGTDPAPWLDELQRARRALPVRVGGQPRWIAVEDVARYRDALGVAAPQGVPQVFLEAAERPLESLVRRYARTHGPFVAADVAARFGVVEGQVEPILRLLASEGALVHGEIRPGGQGAEWCDADVLRRLRRRSIARLRAEVAPVEADVFGRFLPAWHGVVADGGKKPLREAIAQLEGVALPFSVLEEEVLPARVRGFTSQMLDELGASGEVVWVGRGAAGPRDGRVALYRRERAAELLDELEVPEELPEVQRRLLEHVQARGASFFLELQRVASGPQGEPMSNKELLEHVWDLVWRGLLTNDTFLPLRGLRARTRRRGRGEPTIGGRWSATSHLVDPSVAPTKRAHARAVQLLERYGVVSREAAQAAEVPGGFSSLYPVLREMEDAGKVRRGYFVDGMGGAQFAFAGAVDRLRAARELEDDAIVLSAQDPANPWGALLPWPGEAEGPRPRRSAGARVVLVEGEPVLFVEKGGKSLVTLPASRDARRLKAAVTALVNKSTRRNLRIAKVDGVEVAQSEHAPTLVDAGFERDHRGLTLPL